jgi:hypothetical protein
MVKPNFGIKMFTATTATLSEVPEPHPGNDSRLHLAARMPEGKAIVHSHPGSPGFTG